MAGFLLLAPTGSGKSWVCENVPYFVEFATDGDSLINWSFDCETTDWTVQDRKHLDIVLGKMRETRKCICWYVGTTAAADAIADGRLYVDEVGIVVLPPQEHRNLVGGRIKQGHNWDRANEHRNRCENLIQQFQLTHFLSFQDAIEHVRSRLNITLKTRTSHCIRVAVGGDPYINVHSLRSDE